MSFYNRQGSVLISVVLLLATAAQAQDQSVETEQRLLAPEVQTVSAAQQTPAAIQLPVDLKAAAQIALETFGGEVVKAEEITENAATHFQIRVVNEGRVRDVVIDAANGDIISPLEVN